ncbi:MAG: FprA family A-type flavoprotein [Prevotellaceae bacterium]|jgi:flavorubredoxin|nr:FprA family A-type flavoprotein [Prevotellaceae bacterium]
MTTITGEIYYIGVNDRRKALFENMWPLPYGISYNSYLIVDEKTALIDTVDRTIMDNFYENLEEALQGRTLDYLIINHIEPDHSGAIGALLACYPNMIIVGNVQTQKILKNYFGEIEHFLPVADDKELALGQHTLKFYTTPWIHWPETMMTYDTTDGVLFSGDAFGSFRTLDGGIFDDEIAFERDYQDEMLRYYSNIVGKYSNMVQKGLAKLANVAIKAICSTHGPIWRNEPQKVVSLYDQWSKHEADNGTVIAFASMYSNTEQVADSIARELAEQGMRNIKIYDVSKTHVSFIISEVWKYKNIILGSCAYNTAMHPMMAQLCRELAHISPKNKRLGVFGSFSWSGGGVKSLLQFAENIGWEQPAAAVEITGKPNAEKLTVCRNFAAAFAQAVQQ